MFTCVVQEKLKLVVTKSLLFILIGLFFERASGAAQHDDLKVNEKFLIGVNADLSLGAAAAGQAILAGVEIAVEEFNASRAVGQRQAEIMAMDHNGVSLRGVDNLNKISRSQNLIGVIGGIHSNVILTELESIHGLKIPYMIPWAAAVEIVDNGRVPNYVFRIGARDQHVGHFLAEKALRIGIRIALILEQTVWGRSNYRSISERLRSGSLLPLRTEWLSRGAHEFKIQMADIVRSGPQVIIMVLNGPESEMALRELAVLNFKGRILSHWGVTSGGFDHNVLRNSPFLFEFFQAFSFQRNEKELTRKLLKSYLAKHPGTQPKSIQAAAGIAFGYDLTRILLWAAGDEWPLRRDKIREKIEKYRGGLSIADLLDPPFTASRHDALNPSSYFWAQFTENGFIQPSLP